VLHKRERHAQRITAMSLNIVRAFVRMRDQQTGRIVTTERAILSALEEGQDECLVHVPQWQQPEIEIARAVFEDAGQ